MFKIIVSICLLMSISSASKENTYVFEVKGKFAEELKVLLEKYSKDGKVDVKVLKLSDNKKSKGIMSALLHSEENNVNLDRGKQIYDKSCSKCHGINAGTSSYANARILSTLSKQELTNQIESYKMSPSYGGSTKFVMNNAVETLNYGDIKSIVEYIVNINAPIKKQNKIINNNYSSTKKDSYLQ